jgi:hypothetical protein
VGKFEGRVVQGDTRDLNQKRRHYPSAAGKSGIRAQRSATNSGRTKIMMPK